MHLVRHGSVKTFNLTQDGVDKISACGEVKENGWNGNSRFLGDFRMASCSQPSAGKHA
jgi:hypothetical protein